MSETKRRHKQATPDSYEKASTPRQTRVTLAKDVSSKYRKVMPRPGSGQADDGSAPPKRRGPGGPSERPRSPRSFADSEQRPARPPRSFSGERPARPPRSFSGERPARPPRPFSGERPARPPRPFSGERPARPPRSSSDFGRAPRPARDSFDPTAFKAIIHRELPEAAKQVQEAQDIILKTAESTLRLAEQLNAVYDGLQEKLSDPGLLSELAAAREAVTHIFEGMSFQDLVGQRLLKVGDFFKSLDEAAKKAPRPFSDERKSFPRRDGGDRKPFTRREGGDRKPFARREDGDRKPFARREDGDRKAAAAARPEKPKKSRLKGPQAEGFGMGQSDIDKLLSDL